MIVWVYNRWGDQIGCLYDFVEFVHDDELGSLDYIEFMTPGASLVKGNYLLWRDDFGIWREHIVSSCELVHYGDAVYQNIYAVNSLSELNQSYIQERNSYGFSNTVALQRLLENTRWSLGSIDNLGTADVKFYHETVYEGLVDITSKWGGDIVPTITVGASGVTRRTVNHYGKRGSDNGLIFTYGFDMDNISRTEELDEVYTRIHCFGKGEEIYSEETEKDQQNARYGRRITFADINGGKDYVEDNEAMQKYGVIGKDGILQHSEGSFVFGDIEDPRQLLEAGKAKLEEVKAPRITYSANVAILSDAGMDFKNAATGDTVYIRDQTLDERLTGRVNHTRRYLASDRATEITLGNVVRTYYDIAKEQQKALDSLSRRSASWDGAANSAQPWIDRMIDELNDYMNAVSGFVYWEQGEGITVYDRAIDKNPTMAIQLKGGMFRIANKKKSNGEWDWETFGDGNGFTAKLLRTGIIQGGSNWWNLEAGDLFFERGTIQNRAGTSVWDLTNNSFLTVDMTALNINATGRFSCGTSDCMLTIQNGRIEGSGSGTNLGAIDFTAEHTSYDVSGGTPIPRHHRGMFIDGGDYLEESFGWGRGIRVPSSTGYFNSGRDSIEENIVTDASLSGTSLNLTRPKLWLHSYYGRLITCALI